MDAIVEGMVKRYRYEYRNESTSCFIRENLEKL